MTPAPFIPALGLRFCMRCRDIPELLIYVLYLRSSASGAFLRSLAAFLSRPGTAVLDGTSSGKYQGSKGVTMAQAKRSQQPTGRHSGQGPVEAPTDLPASGWTGSVKRTFKQAKDDRISLTAAGVAFYWFLSVFPLLIAAVGILALVHVGHGF